MISAKIVCDSISESGVRITTFEIEVPRIVWSEFMTHRMFSRNASSSRAIPFNKMVENLEGIPFSFGKNQAGMSDAGPHEQLINDLYTPEQWWHFAKLSAVNFSRGYADAGYHKQISGRLTEAFQCIKAVVTATEFSNFFYLRNDTEADPTIHRLAQCMHEEYTKGTPNVLKAGEWHLPYIEKLLNGEHFIYQEGCQHVITLEEAIKVSCARSAAVSYRNTDYGLEKSLQVYDRLVKSSKLHGSALEHQATPMDLPEATYESLKDGSIWQNGVSHMDKDGNMWSGNFRHWVQHRKTLKGENYEG